MLFFGVVVVFVGILLGMHALSSLTLYTSYISPGLYNSSISWPLAASFHLHHPHPPLPPESKERSSERERESAIVLMVESAALALATVLLKALELQDETLLFDNQQLVYFLNGVIGE